MVFPPRGRRAQPAALAFALIAAACGKKAAADGREIPWTYGPAASSASAEHMQGTGKKGPALAVGWQCRLRDGKQLVVRPYQLATSHPLFGKVVLTVGLFDKAEKEITTVRSGVLTADNATATFDLAPDVGARLWDVVIWYSQP